MGHDCEGKHLRISKSDVQNLTVKLSNEVSKTRILKDVHGSSNNESSRMAITTKKDLKNISRHLHFDQSGRFDKNDYSSVDVWKKVHDEKGDVIIFGYKKQGEVDPLYPGLGEDDFLLCFMTRHQKEIIGKLLSWKSSIIEMDATHGTNQYDFKMITLMTKNGNHQGEPLAHMFCTKESLPALKLF